MADLYTVAPLQVIEAGTFTGDYYDLDNVARLIMRAVGTQNSSIIKQIALEGLVAGIAEFKAQYHFKFLEGAELEIPLVDDQQEYALDATTFAIRNVRMTDHTNADHLRDIRIHHMIYDQLVREYDMSGKSKYPQYWAVKNLQTSKYILVWGTPDTPGDVRLTVEWLTEMAAPTFDQGTALVLEGAPDNLLEALISYGKYHLVLTREPDKERVWGHHFAQAWKKIGRAKGQENRESGGPMQMIPAGFRSRGRTGRGPGILR